MVKAKLSVLFVLLFLCGNGLWAQQVDANETDPVTEDSTLNDYLEAYKADTNNGELALKIAVIYLDTEQDEKGLPFILKAQELLPNNDQVQYVLGVYYYYDKKYAFALEAFKKATEIEPNPSYYSFANLNRLMLNTNPAVIDDRRDFVNIHSYNVPEMVKWAQDNTHPYYTKTLMAKFNQDWSSLSLDEFYMLYFGQSVSAEYSPYASSIVDLSKELKAKYSEKDYEAAIQIGTKLYETDPLNIDVNWYLGMSYYKTKQYSLYEKHLGIYRSIMLGIASTGDGNSAKTAYVVIAVSDEYDLIEYLSYRSSGQSLTHADGHSFDILHAVDSETQEKLDVYFNIDQPFGSLSSMFKDVKASDLDKKGKKKKKK